MRLSDMIGIIKLVILVFLKSPPLYIYRAHSCRWRHFFADIPISPHLAMLIRATGSDRAVNSIWHRTVRLKPVRLYNVTIVIRFGCLSLFKTARTISMSSESVSLSSFGCRYVSVSAHPARLKSRNITACHSSAYVTEHWSDSGTIFRRALAGAVQ